MWDAHLLAQVSSLYEKSLLVHQLMVERMLEDKEKTVIPFAMKCQDRLDALGGFPLPHDVNKLTQNPPRLAREFTLPTSRGPYPVRVLDDVLPPEWCQKMIRTAGNVGFGRVPSLQEVRYHSSMQSRIGVERHESSRLNTSKLVQVESQEFADYLWHKIQKHLPDEHKPIRTEGLIKPLPCLGGPNSVYEKRGIIPVFRIMRYRPGQGFKAHVDPIRYYYRYPIHSDKQSKLANYQQAGIFQSIFTVALYLNEEFVGGDLKFVTEKDRSYEFANSNDSRPVVREGKTLETVVPAVGRAAIFRHDELHEGGGVEQGAKYMIQCDVLYECTSLDENCP